MYTRGQLAVIGKVGRKALRLYEEQGLLVPQTVNPENGYRYYAEEQVKELSQILRYKRYGLSLEEIKELLSGKETETALLGKCISVITKDIQDHLEIKKEIERQLNGDSAIVRGQMDKESIAIRSFPAQTVLYRMDSVEIEHLGVSVGKLHEIAARNCLIVTGSHYVRYDNVLDEKDDFTKQTCLPVKGAEQLSEEFVRQEEMCSCLYMRHTAGFSTVGAAYKILQEYSRSNHIMVDGTIFEVYNKDMSVEVYVRIAEIERK